MSLVARCQQSFSPGDRARGRFYQETGRVTLEHVDAERADAVVRNQRGFSYDVSVAWGSGGGVSVDCSCPRFREGIACKHVWATVLQLENDFQIGRSGTLPNGKPQQRARAWQHVLSAVRDRQVDDKQLTPAAPTYLDRRIWYVLEVSQQSEEDRLQLSLLFQDRKKNGDFGVTRNFNLHPYEIQRLRGDADRDILEVIREVARPHGLYGSFTGDPLTYDLPAYLAKSIGPRLAATGRLVWTMDRDLPVEEWRAVGYDEGPPWQFRLDVADDSEAALYNVSGNLVRGDQIRDCAEAITLSEDGLVLFPDMLLNYSGGVSWPAAWRHYGSLQIPHAEGHSFLQALLAVPDAPRFELPPSLQLREQQFDPAPRLVVSNKSGSIELEGDVQFRYGGVVFAKTEAAQLKIDEAAACIVRRDPTAEENCLTPLRELPVQLDSAYRAGDVVFHPRHLHAVVSALVPAGWEVVADGKLVRSPGNFDINVTSGTDWFDLEGHVDFNGQSVALPKLLAAARNSEKFIKLDDGSQGMLPDEWLSRFGHYAELGEVEGDAIRYRKSQALLIDALLAQQEDETVRLDRGFGAWRKKLRSFSGVAPKAEPKGFGGELREYQREGLGWLHFLRDFEFGGCLADDMGLGKTVQVLALLESRRRRRVKDGEVKKPSIVVVPKSLIFNWLDEAKRFTPKLVIHNHTGLDRQARREAADQCDVLLTTYGTLRQDIERLHQEKFDYAILDESQAIKNDKSLASKACRLLQADHRLAMTGTPIENHLGELWALFDFLNPGLLGRAAAFNSLTKTNGGPQDSAELLGKALRPFILRRTKQEVLKELPEKSEQTLYCEMLPKQRKQYEELRDHYRASVNKTIKKKGLSQSKMHVLEALLRLRQAACDPRLIDAKLGSAGAKMAMLVEQLAEVIDEGHKALVFSQFTSLLSLVRKELDAKKWNYAYLDGQTNKRQQQVQRFQEDADCPLFLISLKAGGHGLNLTAAYYVYILDPWWNPAVEAQAIDRAHRLGQTRRVMAYRLICQGTVEEKILELQKSKRQLADSIISGDSSVLRNLTAEDLQLLLS